jgi:hypothetical protein
MHMRGLLALVLAACLSGGGAAGTPEASAVARSVPPGFLPSSTSWTSPQRGWVLGFAPCATGRCPALLRTWDGGQTWRRSLVPDVRLPEDNRRVRIHFANDRVGVLTDGSELYVTRTGGLYWRLVALNGAGPSANIGALADNASTLFAIVSSDAATRLYASPLWRDRWVPAPGVAVPGRADGDIAAAGARAYVAITAVHRFHGYWTLSGGTWLRAEPPCTTDAAVDVGFTGPTVYALCSSNPGMGDMEKRVERSSGGFVPVGRAPDAGITMGFAVASPSTMAVAAVGQGAAFVHRSADGGRTWQTPLVLRGAPVSDLQFMDPRHGVLLWGRPDLGSGRVYATQDGGSTWASLILG